MDPRQTGERYAVRPNEVAELWRLRELRGRLTRFGDDPSTLRQAIKQSVRGALRDALREYPEFDALPAEAVADRVAGQLMGVLGYVKPKRMRPSDPERRIGA